MFLYWAAMVFWGNMYAVLWVNIRSTESELCRDTMDWICAISPVSNVCSNASNPQQSDNHIEGSSSERYSWVVDAL
jgi:hypothetical protein